MLSTSTRLKIQEILGRLEKAETVTFQERIYLKKFADRDQSVASWLLRAKRRQQYSNNPDEIESLLNDLNIGNSEPDSNYKPEDDLGDWFSGAPSWLGRS
tara:strand:+ start:174 stop:473 length:300 start_codon:yes stop_codon:yes gene_type:complete